MSTSTTLPPPAPDQAYCELSALDAGEIHMLLGQLVDVAKGDEMTVLPVLAFVLRHSRTRAVLLFDLGIRPDVHNLGAGALALTAKMGMRLRGADIPALLERGGLPRADVAHVCLSHIHFDHAGVPSAFPRATCVLGGGAKRIIDEQGPAFEGTLYALDLPPERTAFLDDADARWAPLGPFPRALDFYGDGSLYIVDAPGHIPGHINLMVRTSADGGWAYLAGDSAHDWRLLTGEAGIGYHRVFGCIHEDVGKAQETIERLKVVKTIPRVRVLLAHDRPFVEAHNADGKGYWPSVIESL
ncbi:beta-lactamase-like protein [Daedaleopsis nitida]|nr:beta-lactamase-like protein [Daedaleopsis nitida]